MLLPNNSTPSIPSTPHNTLYFAKKMSPSPMYSKLRSTAIAFVHSSDIDPATNELDKDRVRAIRTSDYRHSWGHNYFKSQRPALNHTLDLDAFMSHLETMAPNLKSVETRVPDVLVDEERRSASVRSYFYMTPEGGDETIENDIMWLLEMDETGERVKGAIEFIDAVAAKSIGELVQQAKEED